MKINNILAIMLITLSIVSASISEEKSQAEAAIAEAEKILEDLQNKNLPVTFTNDTLIEAKKEIQIITYMEILKDPLSSPEQKNEARNSLKLIDTRNMSYQRVLEYVSLIKEHQNKILFVYDLLTSTEERVEKEAQNEEEIKSILEDSKEQFKKEQLQEAEESLREIRQKLEERKTLVSEVKGLSLSAKSFIIKYAYQIILGLALIIVLAFISIKIGKRKIIQREIKKLKNEKEILKGLIIKAQEERFKENKISGVVYNIKIRKYQNRINEIRQQLPILENRLRKSR
jgi:hypothetical protein